MKPIAICQNKKIFDHSTSWTYRFIEYCKENEIPFEIVNCYSNEIIGRLDDYSALLWHYGNYVIADLMEARNILQIADNKGLFTFPSPSMNWHFDDKVAEMYAFESVNAPIPQSWVFYIKEECLDWIENKAEFPLVAKLRCGSGSNNVKLLKNKHEAKKYAERMFSRGFSPAPSLRYKAYSKLQSTKNLAMFISRMKRIPEFLNTRAHARMMPTEKGYCYFQQYIPNDGYDIKVVVIGDKMAFFARNVRKNDFRASGGGDFFYDRTLLTDNVIDSAFRTAEELKLYCVGFDYVVDNKTGEGKIIEMCYGFDYEAIKSLGVYVDKNHVWHEEPVCVPDEIVRMALRSVR